jgi:hypothetical protein
MDLAAHLHPVVEIDVVGEHRLRVAFDDGARGEIDASGWRGAGSSSPCATRATSLKSNSLDHELGTTSWPNGADVAPEPQHLWVAGARDPLSA